MLMFCPSRCGSLLDSTSMTFRKTLILLLILFWPISLRTPLCQVVIALSWALPALLSFMPASLTLSFSHIARACLMSSHAEPFYISFAAWNPLFLPGGDFPPSVAILHMYPCIEHWYVLLLGTSLFSHTRLILVCNYKAFLFFFKPFKYLKKSKKIKKPKSRTRKDVIFGSSRVVNRELYITSVCWVNSLNLGYVLISLSLSPLTC